MEKKSSRGSTSSASMISSMEIRRIIEDLKTKGIRESTKENYYKIWKNFNQFYLRLDCNQQIGKIE